ncbi:phosphatase PAP2 family protein [Modestobacter italicus]|uniref:phosphatase PAP2 family protein n=1 Tax=Modestobacter italicus (strain DSM 44449 / CECT 9708 / BC 501) TaxID=2732864 RepID=UPI001C962A37|nr:phosphatase PAP2 family protein [Modestobacter italicus]
MQTARPGTSTAPVRPAWTAVAGCAAVVAGLTWAVAGGSGALLRADRAVSGALYAGDDRSRLVEVALQLLTAPGSSAVRVVVFLPVLAWLVLRRAWWTATFVLTSTALIGPLTTLLKESTGRARPQFAEGGAGWESLSFPSGHSSGIATLVTVALVLAWPRLRPTGRGVWLAAGVVLVVLVGLTRLWLGVHFPSDVVAGWALGAGWTLLVALALGALPGGRAALGPRSATMDP